MTATPTPTPTTMKHPAIRLIAILLLFTFVSAFTYTPALFSSISQVLAMLISAIPVFTISCGGEGLHLMDPWWMVYGCSVRSVSEGHTM